MPEDVARKITAHASKMYLSGARSVEVEQYVRALAPKLADSRIRLIARTETSKAETALTRERSLNIGADWYQWQSSRDSRVRPSHKNMDGVIVAWNNPPSPEQLIGEHSTLGRYHAGSTVQCRCIALPIVSLDEIRWPARVYTGSIVMMTRAAFAKKYGEKIAA